MSRVLRLVRIVLGVGLMIAAARWVIAAWAERPVLGVMPWGDPTGLRVNPLGPRETADAIRRERDLADAWTGVDGPA